MYGGGGGGVLYNLEGDAVIDWEQEIPGPRLIIVWQGMLHVLFILQFRTCFLFRSFHTKEK